MTTTVNASPIHSIVEATQFVGTPESAFEIMDILRRGFAAVNNYSLSFSYSENAGQEPGLFVYLDGNGQTVATGDWIIKDGDLFSVCHSANFPLRYATEAAAS